MNRKSDIAIDVRNVTVNYRAYTNRPTSLKDAVVQYLRTGKLRYYSHFKALSDVSFAVQRGTALGVIGSNGAGKSTLLRVLSQVLPPSSGSVVMNGRIDSLIQLGSGFDMELTAYENIFLHGSLLGRSRKELAGSVDRILDFAELREFSSTPMKYFSAGMSARLGFSCAIETNPDILLVDEVLAVGDERFAKKCQDFFTEFRRSNRTMVIISHGVEQLAKEVDQILVLSRGEVAYFGDPEEAVRIYRDPSYRTRLQVALNQGATATRAEVAPIP
ncbi:MAG: ABC transporter ATP-binding protein [Proteobacteria bacterium]|nr:ABC transporter ATP-binding protein [Pseudomonadota bacterium]